MPKEYVALSPVEYVDRGVTKTSFRRIGPAFPARNADGFDINLELLPPPQVRTTTDAKGNQIHEFYYRILVREKTERSEHRQKPDAPSKDQHGTSEDDIDDIPF